VLHRDIARSILPHEGGAGGDFGASAAIDAAGGADAIGSSSGRRLRVGAGRGDRLDAWCDLYALTTLFEMWRAPAMPG
jgi:hypothetical protein